MQWYIYSCDDPNSENGAHQRRETPKFGDVFSGKELWERDFSGQRFLSGKTCLLRHESEHGCKYSCVPYTKLKFSKMVIKNSRINKLLKIMELKSCLTSN